MHLAQRIMEELTCYVDLSPYGAIQAGGRYRAPVVATQKESSGYLSWALLLFRPLSRNREHFLGWQGSNCRSARV